MYRGRWHTAQELGTTSHSGVEPRAPTRRQRNAATGWQAAQRLKVRSYNVGGVTSEVYDVMHRWLTTSCQDDVVVVQELHHGCGKTDHGWQIPGWSVMITADARNRYSGVGVFISKRIATEDRISCSTWLQGRLLHVRCFTNRVTIDVVAGYQWVWQGRDHETAVANRSLFWGKLSALLQTLPARNLVVVAMDANTQLQPLPGLIGRGVLRTNQHRDLEFEALLQAQNLVVLNSWGSSSRQTCHTFANGSTYSQIDVVALRRPMADATARRAAPGSLDLVPWRRGPKHRCITASVPMRAGWLYQGKPAAQRLKFSLPELRASIKAWDSKAQQLQAFLSDTLTGGTVQQISEVNSRTLVKCQELYPLSRTTPQKPSTSPAVLRSIDHMWRTHRELHQGREPRNLRGMMNAYRKLMQFQRASRELKRESRQARRAWFEDQIQTAEKAPGNTTLLPCTGLSIALHLDEDESQLGSVEPRVNYFRLLPSSLPFLNTIRVPSAHHWRVRIA